MHRAKASTPATKTSCRSISARQRSASYVFAVARRRCSPWWTAVKLIKKPFYVMPADSVVDAGDVVAFVQHECPFWEENMAIFSRLLFASPSNCRRPSQQHASLVTRDSLTAEYTPARAKQLWKLSTVDLGSMTWATQHIKKFPITRI